jgi:curved DNA-binding protein CbpA
VELPVLDFEHLDYYELLGIDRSASTEEIKRAYRREISKYHPDRFVNGTPEEQDYAQLRSQRLTEAYTVLSDFTARSAYNRGQTPVKRPSARQWSAPTEAQPRDYQAELYEQARGHLEAGRTLQAIGVLRQLHQINPFYRDSADLLTRAESQMQPQAPPPEERRRRIPPLLWAVAGVAGIAVLAALAWALLPRGGQQTTGQATSPAVGQAATAPAGPTAAPPEPTAPSLPTKAAPTAAPATAAPATDEPTSVPTDEPTSVPTDEPTSAPTSAPVLADGRVIFSDNFSGSGWADTSGNGWSVGYDGGGYRITAIAGAGPIWSYRSGVPANLGITVDLRARSGEGGLLMRFTDAGYLGVILNPQAGTYRVEQRANGVSNVLDSGSSELIQSGANAANRLAARLSGSTLEVLINDQRVASVDVRSAPSSNRYGLVAIGGSASADVLFDNLEIRALQ